MSTAASNKNHFASDDWKRYADEVKRRSYGNWDSIMSCIAPAEMNLAIERYAKHVPCPRHGGTDGFRVFRDFRETGGSICNQCGSFKDGFATLHWLYGWTFSQAIRAVADVVGVPYYRDTNPTAPTKPKIELVPPPKRKTAEEVAREDEYKAQRMSEAWNGGFGIVEVESQIARDYLRNRGITSAAAPLDDLRFHPGMPYFENGVNLGEFPTLLCLLRQPSGSPCSLQRIFLSPEGTKAALEHPKKIMPYRSTAQYAGSAVRLDHDVGTVLCVTEGVETGLAWRAMTGLPTWSTCVAGLMEEVVVPESVEIVIACGDRDLATMGHEHGRGTTAAEKLVARVQASGRKAVMYLPPFDPPEGAAKGVDWLDVLSSYGLGAARQEAFITDVRDQLRNQLAELGYDWASVNAHF
ncbi:MAG: hypothetical protein A2580_09140 [Hydrogenophilales bacterium RIFOXYD1_FULL_62_11]|nr:MAG: hypothetical protein A2580_09140 [Hydrogenophilales bacterium RIFOXYD1_FULL_62_11]